MKDKNLIFRVDGGSIYSLAMGHVFRCLRLAKQLSEINVNCLFLMKNFPEGVKVVTSSGFVTKLLHPEISVQKEASALVTFALDKNAIVFFDLRSSINHLLFNAVKNEARSFIAALYLLTIAIILTSSLMYYAEGDTQPEHFSSIPASMYWAIITLTTVGFGDISPVTWIGQVLATITAFIGVCTVAMLTGIVASSFATQMARRRVVYESQLREAYKDGVLSDEEKKMLLKLRTDFNLSEEQIKSINQQVEDEIKQSK